MRYPATARPTLQTDSGPFEVCELSEAGLRFSVAEGSALPFDTDVLGLLELPNDTYAVEGRLLRLDEHEAVVVLSEGVGFQAMVAEQKRLIRKYPGMFGRKAP